LGKERAIMLQVQTQLKTINGSGSYTYDVSGDDQVVIGDTFASHRIPGVYIFANGVSTSQTAGRTVLSRYDREMKIQLEAWTASTSSTPGVALLDAMDLQDDIMRALEGDRSIGGNARDVEIEATAYDGAELDRPGLGMAVLLVTIRYTETAGA
jgi:hypothetical protein